MAMAQEQTIMAPAQERTIMAMAQEQTESCGTGAGASCGGTGNSTNTLGTGLSTWSAFGTDYNYSGGISQRSLERIKSLWILRREIESFGDIKDSISRLKWSKKTKKRMKLYNGIIETGCKLCRALNTIAFRCWPGHDCVIIHGNCSLSDKI